MANSHIFKLVKAYLTGDTAEKSAIFIEKRAHQAIIMAISQLENDRLNLEITRDNCNEALDCSLINTGDSKKFDSTNYLSTVLRCQNDLLDAAAALDTNQRTIDFWKSKLELFSFSESCTPVE